MGWDIKGISILAFLENINCYSINIIPRKGIVELQMTFLLLIRQYISWWRRNFFTFLWRFLQTRKIRTTSKMTPSPTMMTGKLDTTVTISRSVLICAADPSSIVAVWKFSRNAAKTNYLFEQKTWYSEGSKDDMKAHLVDKHDGENCLIQEFCFAEKEKMEVSLAFF